MARRCDTVVYDRHLRPIAIVEYKAPSVSVTVEVFEQAARYNMVLGVPYLIISNGLRHFCFYRDGDTGSYMPIDHIPSYEEMLLARPQ